MELLGDNLEVLLNLCGKKFTLKTVLLLVDQMVKIIEIKTLEINSYKQLNLFIIEDFCIEI